MKKLYVARMEIMVEFVKTRVRQDQCSALPQEWFVAEHVEVITKRHHLHEQRIQRRVNVVRRYVRNSRDHDVALALYRNLVLAVIQFEDLFVDRFRGTGKTSDQFILRRDSMKHFAPCAAR